MRFVSSLSARAAGRERCVIRQEYNLAKGILTFYRPRTGAGRVVKSVRGHRAQLLRGGAKTWPAPCITLLGSHRMNDRRPQCYRITALQSLKCSIRACEFSLFFWSVSIMLSSWPMRMRSDVSIIFFCEQILDYIKIHELLAILGYMRGSRALTTLTLKLLLTPQTSFIY